MPTKNGRPPALVADAKTLRTVTGLGKIQATTKECAAVLGVSEPTYIAFKKRHAPDVENAYLRGSGEGLASLRRRQFKAAQDGNATMLVWLGKQYLGQTDKQEIAQTVQVEVKDAREELARLIDKHAAASREDGAARTAH